MLSARDAALAAGQPPEFRVSTSTQSGVVVIYVRGELDLAAAPEVATLLQFVAYESRAVLVDLCDTTFMDTGGLRALLTANTQITRSGRRFAIACPQRGAVARLLELTGTRTLLSAWPDRVTAISALRG